MQQAISDMPALGFGTWQMTGRDARDGVRDALELGYRHIDTARAYGNEREVGAGLRDSGVPREEVFLTTKVWLDDLEPTRLRASAEASLRDLAVDHVDLLLLHWPNPRVPLEASLGELQRVREDGLARHIGVSNFPPAMFRRALELAPVFTDQVEFHPFLGQDELLRIAQDSGSSLTAYSPLAEGRAVHDPTLQEIARRLGATPAQVALRWLLDQPRTSVIPKAASPERRRENLGALELELGDDDRAAIDALPKNRRGSNPSWGPRWED